MPYPLLLVSTQKGKEPQASGLAAFSPCEQTLKTLTPTTHRSSYGLSMMCKCYYVMYHLVLQKMKKKTSIAYPSKKTKEKNMGLAPHSSHAPGLVDSMDVTKGSRLGRRPRKSLGEEKSSINSKSQQFFILKISI